MAQRVPGWYLKEPNSNQASYWDGNRFTGDSSPLFGQKFEVLDPEVVAVPVVASTGYQRKPKKKRSIKFGIIVTVSTVAFFSLVVLASAFVPHGEQTPVANETSEPSENPYSEEASTVDNGDYVLENAAALGLPEEINGVVQADVITSTRPNVIHYPEQEPDLTFTPEQTAAYLELVKTDPTKLQGAPDEALITLATETCSRLYYNSGIDSIRRTWIRIELPDGLGELAMSAAVVSLCPQYTNALTYFDIAH